MTWVRILTDGSVTPMPGVPKYDQINQAVGGYIEALGIVVAGKRVTLYLNEEGKLDNLPLNPIATSLTRGVVAEWDLIVGDVVVTGPPDGEGNDTGLAPEVVTALALMSPHLPGQTLTVTVYLNEGGLSWSPIGRLFGYTPGDVLRKVIEYEESGPDREILERAFFEFNESTGPLAAEYRKGRNRSLSVGDVVSVGGTWFSCETVGWKRIEKPTEETI
jgi:hypothetical protein